MTLSSKGDARVSAAEACGRVPARGAPVVFGRKPEPIRLGLPADTECDCTCQGEGATESAACAAGEPRDCHPCSRCAGRIVFHYMRRGRHAAVRYVPHRVAVVRDRGGCSRTQQDVNVRLCGVSAGERQHAFGFESHPPHPASPGRIVLTWGNAFFWGFLRAAFAARGAANVVLGSGATSLAWL